MSNFTVLNRAHFDEFTYDLFDQMLGTVSYDYEAYYTWPADGVELLSNLFRSGQFTKPNIIIGVKDVFLDRGEEASSFGASLLTQCTTRHRDKNFIIVTSLENIEAEINIPNVQFVHWGGDLTNQSHQYPLVTPILDKNFESTKTFIALNRNTRQHRVVALCYLYGQHMTQYGNVTYMSVSENTAETFMDRIPWKFREEHDALKEVLSRGYMGMLADPNLGKVNRESIYAIKDGNDNVTNFEINLRSAYQDSFVELISETSFYSPSFNVTEKTLNSIYACNFPIWISSPGVVALMRAIGFDVFDDFIDHSYDTIQDPVDRIVSAIDKNSKLLTDSTYVKNLWLTHNERLLYNVNVAKKMYDWFADRAKKEMNSVVFK